jgi:solute:Na+ symporter, SSS family
MHNLDWTIVAVYCLVMLGIGLYFSRRASESPEHFFIGGRDMPWWLIGLSDVTSYGASVVSFVMLFFIAGFNEYWVVAWVSWCVWMPLVAVLWSKMWRRLGVVTTGEFIECRYGGKAATTYRVAYALYAYGAWAVIVLAYSAVWFTQTIAPILGWTPFQVLMVFGTITAAYTLLSGFIGVVFTEFVQFFLIMAASLVLMFIVVGKAGGLEVMYAKVIAARGVDFLQPLPIGERLGGITLLVLVVQGLFFAGSPMAGEGITAQRAMSARNERHAIMGQIFNCCLSLVVRMVPAVFTGLAAVALYPRDQVANPAALWATMVHDYVPTGLLGLMFAGAIGSFMAGVSAFINWGSSYLVNDIYRRHLRPRATQREYIAVSRVLTVATLVLSFAMALCFDVTKLESWVIFINSMVIVFSLPLAWLKWFWWRMNVWGDAVGMLCAFPLAFLVCFGCDALHIPAFGNLDQHPFWQGFLILFVAGWAVILTVTLLTPPEDPAILKAFYRKVMPLGVWGPIAKQVEPEVRAEANRETLREIWACVWGVVFCFLMVTAFFALCARRYTLGAGCTLGSITAGWLFFRAALSAVAFKKSDET